MTTASPSPAPTETPVPGSGHLKQAFLVGEEVYVRPAEPVDAKRGQSWTTTIFPRSTARYEKWIKEEMAKQRRRGTYVILRKADDVPVGSIRTWHYEPRTFIEAHVDPLYGERGLRWKAEALRMVVPWLGDEQERPLIGVTVASNDHLAIETVEALGMRQVVRFREKLRTWGDRTDELAYEYLNPHWVARLGDPATIELARTGTGDPRPVPTPVTGLVDPPTNAVRVGERTYLRPLTKDDAPLVARWYRQETELFWDAGRWLYPTPDLEHWTASIQKEHPARHVRFAICLRENDELIGSLGLAGINYHHGVAESESEIHRPEYRGGGYGSEAKHLLFDYAFNTLNLHALQSFVIFPNTRSAAALRKQGYREAGRLHWAFPSFGTFENFVVFDLLAADWRALPRTSEAAEGGRAT